MQGVYFIHSYVVLWSLSPDTQVSFELPRLSPCVSPHPHYHKAGSGLCNPPPRISHPALVSCLALTVITKDADNWLVYPCFLSGSPQTGILTLGSPSCP